MKVSEISLSLALEILGNQEILLKTVTKQYNKIKKIEVDQGKTIQIKLSNNSEAPVIPLPKGKGHYCHRERMK